jgi:hypothetical protein
MWRRSRLACFASFFALTASLRAAEPAPQEPAKIGDVLEARDEQGRSIQIRIDRIETDPRDHEIELYTASVRAAKGGRRWLPYCQPDRDGRRTAIPLAGSWDATGAWSAANGAITFACTSGAIGKCVRFGYKPWKTVEGRSLADHHLACVRMVRADYCGDGRSHTKDGMWIDVYDTLGIQVRVPEVETGPVWLEAGWSPDGATYLNRPRLSDDPRAVADECPGKLGPHVPDAQHPPLTAEQIRERRPDTLVFNDRRVDP